MLDFDYLENSTLIITNDPIYGQILCGELVHMPQCLEIERIDIRLGRCCDITILVKLLGITIL